MKHNQTEQLQLHSCPCRNIGKMGPFFLQMIGPEKNRLICKIKIGTLRKFAMLWSFAAYNDANAAVPAGAEAHKIAYFVSLLVQ
jgi:hypothetical protein